MNIFILLVMVVSIILGEVLFPLEGVRGEGIPFLNDSNCINNSAGTYECVISITVNFLNSLDTLDHGFCPLLYLVRNRMLVGRGLPHHAQSLEEVGYFTRFCSSGS